ncbi:MAG: hypothetical protein AB1938_26825 [Myxococcota bacterium]
MGRWLAIAVALWGGVALADMAPLFGFDRSEPCNDKPRGATCDYRARDDDRPANQRARQPGRCERVLDASRPLFVYTVCMRVLPDGGVTSDRPLTVLSAEEEKDWEQKRLQQVAVDRAAAEQQARRDEEARVAARKRAEAEKEARAAAEKQQRDDEQQRAEVGRRNRLLAIGALTLAGLALVFWVQRRWG